MAEAAENYVELKDMFKDSDVELPGDMWTEQCANYYGNSPGNILEKIQGDLAAKGQAGLHYLIDKSKTPYEHYYFSGVVPKMTGVSLCFMAAQSLNSDYGCYLFDTTYKKNPKSEKDGEFKAEFTSWFGFAPCQWKAEMTKIDEETLEESKVMEDQNDNMLFWHMWQYQKAKPETLTTLKKMKFSLAGNQYKVIKVDTTGASDCIVSAQGNGECLCAAKTKEGILVMNWASSQYKGEGRRKWGSLKGKNVQFYQAVKELFQEYELLTIDGDGYQ